jgi:hypothetical protein
MRLSVAVVDGWVFKERLTASRAFWAEATKGGRSETYLARAAPLPKVRPPISVPSRPRPWAEPSGEQPTRTMAAAHVASCTEKGAFGQEFGATSLKGRPRPRILNSQRVYPDPGIAGIEQVEAVLTDRSSRVHTLTSLTPHLTDEAVLPGLMGAARAEALRLGWSLQDDDGNVMTFVRLGADGKPAVELEIGELLGTFSVSCKSPELFALTKRELTRPDRPAVKPTPPQPPPPPPPFWHVDCNDPGRQSIILAGLRDYSDARLGASSAWDRHQEQVMQWKVGQIQTKARLSNAQTADLVLRSASTGMATGFADNLAALGIGIDALLEADDAMSDGDYRTACQRSVAWLRTTERIGYGNSSQWDGMNRFLDAEARRRGVVFD